MKRKIQVEIFSRESIERLLLEEVPENVAVISFYDTPMIENDPYCVPVAYPKDMIVYYSQTDDIAYECLGQRGYTEDSYFTDSNEMAKFILSCADKGITKFICQCEFGQSRSSGTAAAIAEFFNHSGADIFENDRYSPNQLIYDKLMRALVTQNFLNQIKL